MASKDETSHESSHLESETPSLALLLLSDSALPLGSFAFSSGLESFLAHRKLSGSSDLQTVQAKESPSSILLTFLNQSLDSLASTSLPYIVAAWKEPPRLQEFDDVYDASTPCTVARRASTVQGRALLSVWERSFRSSACSGGEQWQEVLLKYIRLVRSSPSTSTNSSSDLEKNRLEIPAAHGHFPPAWGAITRLMDLTLSQATYVFLYNHVKAVLSAAVRLSVIGPYQAQALLATRDVRLYIQEALQKGKGTSIEDAGQSVPMLDIWQGRHELLYSRIFNS
jgi:urease accessory protein